MQRPHWDIAVLTGDFIASVNLPARELDRALALVSDTITDFADDAVLEFSRSRGDGWQAALTSDASPLRIALAISAALCAENASFATRTAIATGHRSEGLPTDLNAATGPIFTASGRALDAMKGDPRITHATDTRENACARLADAIAQTWTPTQARTALHLIHPSAPTRAEVAKTLGVSRQAVDKSAHGAQLPAILDALDMIETAG